MSDLISRRAISAWLYNMGHEKLSEYVLDEKRFPSEDRPNDEWLRDMIYDYLKEKLGEDIVNNPFEFEDWFNRMAWHVKECDRLAKLADRPKGEWKIQDTSYWRKTSAGDVQVNRANLKCTNCGHKPAVMQRVLNFCPNCGADMRG